MTSQQPVTTDLEEGRIADKLLEYLRRELGRPDLSYAEAPARLAGGNETFIYAFRLDRAPEAFSGPVILRAFREHYGRPGQARWEAEVQNTVAELGYPAPRALLVCPTSDVLGAEFFIMERLPGRMVLEGIGGLDAKGEMRFQRYQYFTRAPSLLAEIPRICAEAQVKLHVLDAQQLLRTFERAGLPLGTLTVKGRLDDLRRRIEEARLDCLGAGLSWLMNHQPHPPERLAICHGDTQPNNILMSGREITGVVDWSQTIVADPALDVGFTKVAFETVPLQLPMFMQWTTRPMGWLLARRYLNAYRRHAAVDPDAVRYYEAFRCVFVLALISSRRLAGRMEPDVWDSPIGVKNLVSHVRQITGFTLKIPAGD